MVDYRGSSDDELDEGLYNDFETACSAIGHLFKNQHWRNFQMAAMNTTQLYKAALEAKKRAMEKGIQMSRRQITKDLISLKRYPNNKVDLQELWTLLSKHALIPNEQMLPRQRPYSNRTEGSAAAVHLFQQALNPTSTSPTSHGQRPATELTNFLQSQIRRHRKRSHSPMSPMDIQHGGGSPTSFSYSPNSTHHNHHHKRRRM